MGEPLKWPKAKKDGIWGGDPPPNGEGLGRGCAYYERDVLYLNSLLL